MDVLVNDGKILFRGCWVGCDAGCVREWTS